MRNTVAILLTMALFCNMGPSASYAASAYSLTPVKDNSPLTLSDNVSGNALGYSVRFITEKQLFQGVDDARDYYYEVPRADLGTNNYVELHYSHSELLDPSISTLTVFIDDKPLASSFLDKTNSKSGRLRIVLSSDQLTPGYHKITIAKHGTVSDDLCEDESNPANWLRVEPTSFLFLDTKNIYTVRDPLKVYPYPFVEAGTPEEAFGTVVVPDQTSSEVIAAALQITSSLAKMTSTKKTIPIIKESTWEQYEKRSHAIMVGPANEWKGPIKQQIGQLKLDAANTPFSLDSFVLKSNTSPKSKLVLLVTGSTAQEIEKHVSILTDPALRKQLAGSHLQVAESPSVLSDKSVDPAKQITLAAAGYDHMLLTPTKRETGTFSLQLPAHWKITGDGTLDLTVKLSPLFWSKELVAAEKDKEVLDKRGLTITINGQPATFSAAQLGELAGEKDSFSLKVPVAKELLDKTSTLEVSFTGHFGTVKNACSPDHGEGQWIFIDKQSRLSAPHELSADNSFAYWPAPFVTDSGLDETAFLVPEHLDDTAYQQLSYLVNQLAKNTLQPEHITVYQEPLTENQQKELAGYNVIALGGAKALKTLQAAQDKLLLKEKNQQLSLQPYGIINETTRYIAWIQPSPWDAEHSLAVFQSVQPQAKAAGFLGATLLTYLEGAREAGQIAVMSMSDATFMVNLQQEQQATPAQAAPQLVKQVPIWLIAVFVGVGVLLLIVIARLRRKDKRRKRN
ncbi:cellulose biosynthesis cyclic di-GMP-binding regulatory protein BcsB [Brevibacillus fulvus]